MENLQVKVKSSCAVAILLLICFTSNLEAWNTEYTIHGGDAFSKDFEPHIMTLDGHRYRRDVSEPTSTVKSSAAASPDPTVPSTNNSVPIAPTKLDSNDTKTNITNVDINRTTNVTNSSTSVPKVTIGVTQVPPLGFNGSGILHVNITENTPKVSDPIVADDNISDVFQSPETIKAEKNIKNLTYDNHEFYNSSFVGNVEHFNEYWQNITKPKTEIHTVLSNSHRRATTFKLSFDFPFYGHFIRTITVATGGFIYTGEHVHNWLAATQYIAPLMANFDTTLTNESLVKYYDDGEKFTVFWENVTLQEDPTKEFTFAVTLYNNGDIVFAYKNIPIPVNKINDMEHPVKVGISDAYLADKIIFYVRRKTIYEYHRVSFKNHEITNNTILRLVALPTCLQYKTCESCVNHNTGFECSWCEQIHKCSSGTDRNKQDWVQRNCDKSTISTIQSCPSRPASGHPDEDNTHYSTDTDNATISKTSVTVNQYNPPEVTKSLSPENPIHSPVKAESVPEPHSSIGGVVAAFVTVTLICSLVVWVLYAFKNPHTRSGQFLIKYRPSQWSWRRGEARYTAATIHM